MKNYWFTMISNGNGTNKQQLLQPSNNAALIHYRYHENAQWVKTQCHQDRSRLHKILFISMSIGVSLKLKLSYNLESRIKTHSVRSPPPSVPREKRATTRGKSFG